LSSQERINQEKLPLCHHCFLLIESPFLGHCERSAAIWKNKKDDYFFITMLFIAMEFGFPFSLTICVYSVSLSFGRGNDRVFFWIFGLFIIVFLFLDCGADCDSSQ
jgi:hypothetical protein